MISIYSYRNLYINVHSSILVIIKKWEEPKCLSSEEQINKISEEQINKIHTMVYYLAMKRNEILIDATYDIDES